MSSKMVFGVALIVPLLLLTSIGFAEESSPLHKAPWPIHNGHNYQPTEDQLRALHLEVPIGQRKSSRSAPVSALFLNYVVRPSDFTESFLRSVAGLQATQPIPPILRECAPVYPYARL
jgi:hypothetical protein